MSNPTHLIPTLDGLPKLHMRIHKGERYVTAASVQMLLKIDTAKLSATMAQFPYWRTHQEPTALLLHHSTLMPLTLRLMTHVPSDRYAAAHWLKDGAVHRILNYKIEGEVRPQELRVLVDRDTPQPTMQTLSSGQSVTSPMPLISQREVGGIQINAVNARDLHEALGAKNRFNDWIGERIQQYGFVEHRDFETFTENTVKLGRPAVEYAISLDMAKELAMVERTPKGKEVRTYFIECERKLQGSGSGLLSTIHSSIQTLMHKVTDYFTQNDKRIERLEHQISLLSQSKPSTRTLIKTDQYITFQAAARQLGIPLRAATVPTRTLMGYLVQHDWIVRDGSGWMPRAQFVREGMLVHKPTCRLTQKGLDCLMREFV